MDIRTDSEKAEMKKVRDELFALKSKLEAEQTNEPITKSATSKEVQRAIEQLKYAREQDREFDDGTFVDSLDLAITALQAYQLPSAIKWTGDNLREVINLIGWNESASSRWTWEEYEQIVKKKGLKIFTPDGSVITEVGSWIVRDGKYCHALQAYQPKESCTIEFDDPEYFVGECSNCEYEIDPDYGWSYCPGCGRRIE